MKASLHEARHFVTGKGTPPGTPDEARFDCPSRGCRFLEGASRCAMELSSGDAHHLGDVVGVVSGEFGVYFFDVCLAVLPGAEPRDKDALP